MEDFWWHNDTPVRAITLADLDREYQRAMLGPDHPSVMWIRCEDCGRSFELPFDNDVLCEHLGVYLSKRLVVP